MKRNRSTFRVAVLALLVVVTGGFGEAIEDGGDKVASPRQGVKALDVPGIHNLFALGTHVLSGSSPEGEEGFAALARMGVRTLISVDGAKPDVERARKYGMRYVHLPHGYDGIDTTLQLRLARAAQTLPGPIFIHCHHGKHRGPAAAAILCMANAEWTPAQAESWLVTAGTATNYAGLFDVIRTFRTPRPDELERVSTDFPETAAVSGLVEAMVEVDETWERLKVVRAAGYQATERHPDVAPANEAVMLWERYREAQRLPDAAQLGPTFIEGLRVAEEEAKEAERLLRLYLSEPKPELHEALDKAFGMMSRSCVTCHESHRDR